jgi:WD40 repeat protein
LIYELFNAIINLSHKILVGLKVSFQSTTKREAIMNKITKRMLLIFVSLLVSAFLTACGASQTELVVTATLTGIVPTDTSTSRPTEIATLVPSATPIPTRTNTPTPQRIETPLPTLPKPADLLVPPPQFQARLNRGGIGGMAVSPGGYWLAVTSINHLCLYDTVSFKEAWCLLSDAIFPFIPPVFSKNENYLAFKQGNGNIVILDWMVGERIQVIEGKSEWNAKFTFSPDGGQIAVNLEIGPDPSAENYYSPSFWNTLTGQRIESISDSRLFNGYWDDILWSPDGGRIATCDADDGDYIIWNSKNFEELLEIKTLHTITGNQGLYAFKSGCTWSPDGKFIYTHSNQLWIEKWDAVTGQQIFSREVNAYPSSLAVSPDGKWLAIGDIGGLHLVIDTESGKIVKKINSSGINLDWLDNNRLVFQSDRRSISIWDISADEQTDIQLPGYDFIEGLTWLPGNKITTISDDGSLRIWQAEDWQRVEEYTALLTPSDFSIMGTIVASPDSTLLAASSGGQVFVLDTQTKQELFKLEPDDLSKWRYISDLCWSTDGRWLAGIITAVSNTAVLVWDVQSHDLLLTIPVGEETASHFLAWSPVDENQFALGMRVFNSITEYDPGTLYVKIWDMESHQEIQSIDTGRKANRVLDITWLDANRVIVVYNSSDGDWVELWDVGGFRVNRFSIDNVVGLSPDGRIIVTFSDGQLELIKWETGERYIVDNTGLAFWSLPVEFSPEMRFLVARSGGAVTIWDVSEFTVQ